MEQYTYNWDDFEKSAFPKYWSYVYLVTKHQLSREILVSLIWAGAFDSEELILNQTMIKINAMFDNRRYYRATHEHPNEVYCSEYTKGRRMVKIMDMFFSEQVLTVDILTMRRPNVRYEWRSGYNICRNNVSIPFKTFLRRLKRDIQ